MSFRGLIVGAVLFAALAGGVWWSVNKDKKDESCRRRNEVRLA